MKDFYQKFYKEWEQIKDVDGTLKQFSLEVGEIKDVSVPENYLKLWKQINLPIQKNKAKTHGLSEERSVACFSTLHKRAFFLTRVAKFFNAKNIVEVGTAEGWQFFSFAEYAKEVSGHVWSCDLRDVRHKESVSQYENTTFHLGDSKSLRQLIGDQKIDLFYIDGAHDKGSVLKDVINLRELQSEKCIWIFDDFDFRFGCFDDIKFLCSKADKHKVYSVGETASGQPTHQVIIFENL